MPDRESGFEVAPHGGLMNLQRRWLGPENPANARVVAFDVLPHPDPHDESSSTPGDRPGRSVDRSREPVDSPREELAVGPEPVPPAASQPLSTANGPHHQDSRRQEWCAIVFAVVNRQGEFRVVALDNTGQRQVVAQSPSFRARRSGPVSQRGRARTAHDLLVDRLLALGWRPVASRSRRWHDTAFTRTVPSGQRSVERLVVVCRNGRLTARFQAARFDELGSATVVAESPSFRAVKARGSMRSTGRAEKAHNGLLERLEAEGWQMTESGGEAIAWYVRVLERPVGLRPVE